MIKNIVMVIIIIILIRSSSSNDINIDRISPDLVGDIATAVVISIFLLL